MTEKQKHWMRIFAIIAAIIILILLLTRKGQNILQQAAQAIPSFTPGTFEPSQYSVNGLPGYVANNLGFPIFNLGPAPNLPTVAPYTGEMPTTPQSCLFCLRESSYNVPISPPLPMPGPAQIFTEPNYQTVYVQAPGPAATTSFTSYPTFGMTTENVGIVV